MAWKCDGENDCFDGSDETSDLCQDFDECHSFTRFQCKSGHCIFKSVHNISVLPKKFAVYISVLFKNFAIFISVLPKNYVISGG